MAMFKPITKWSERVMDASASRKSSTRRSASPPAANRARSISTCRPTCYTTADEDNRCVSQEAARGAAPVSGDPALVRQAIALLKQAQRPVILTGTGSVLVAVRWKELKEFVDLSGIPFYTTPQGRGVVPEDHPAELPRRPQPGVEGGRRGPGGWHASQLHHRLRSAAAMGADVKIIQVDISDEEIGRNRPVDIGIVGDAKMVLRQLIEEGRDAFKGRKELPWVETLRGYDKSSRRSPAPCWNSDAVPIHPMRLCKEVREFMDRDAIIVVDGHEILNFARQSIPTFVPGHRVNAGPNGCMGVAVPFGLGAKVAKPNTQVIVLSGDGSFGMNGMEIDTDDSP